MKDLPMYNPESKKEEKSQARLDYEEGLTLFKNGELAQAANMFHNALISFEQEKDMIGVANATDKLADICAERRELDKALQMYDRVIEICFDQGDNISVFSIDKKKAKLFADCGKFAEAIDNYLTIMEHYQAMRNPQGTVETLEKLADVYVKAGNLEKAADCYRTAASIHANYKHKRHAEEFFKKAEEVLATA